VKLSFFKREVTYLEKTSTRRLNRTSKQRESSLCFQRIFSPLCNRM